MELLSVGKDNSANESQWKQNNVIDSEENVRRRVVCASRIPDSPPVPFIFKMIQHKLM